MMTPKNEMQTVLAFALVELVKQGVPLAIDLVQVMAKENATDADWDALRGRWAKSYDARMAEALQRALPLGA